MNTTGLSQWRPTLARAFRSSRLGSTRRAPLLVASLAAASQFLSAQEFHSNDLTPPGSASGRINAATLATQVGAGVVAGSPHALVLHGNALTATDLHPAAYYYSMAMCTDDSQHGGWGYSTLGGIHALVWNGTTSYADLHPSGYNFSYCLGVHEGEQVGYAQQQSYFVTASHAYCWHGSAASGIDLHPIGSLYPFSRALGCRSGEQVGYLSSLAYPDGDSSGYHTTSRAAKWNGSASSLVDLHPAGYDASEATCTSGSQQGGWAYLAVGTSHQHAMLWSGAASSAVDLHPAAYTDSKINALTSTVQVGEGWTGPQGYSTSQRHALAWYGSAESVVDLNVFLPPGYTNAVATGVNSNGDIVGYAYNGYHPTGLGVPAGAIAVLFAPGAPPASQLATLAFTPISVAPGDAAQITVALGSAAPAGGVRIDFLSASPTLLATPASVTIPEGESSLTFPSTTGNVGLVAPTLVKLYATDGAVSRTATLTLKPIAKLASFAINAVEGGFSTRGTVSLNIPAQAGGATVSLVSGNPGLVAPPASIALPQGYSSLSFTLNTAPVTSATTVPVTATLDGVTLTANVALSPAPVVSLSGISAPEIIGGQLLPVTVSLNNFVRSPSGAVVSLQSGDPAAVTVPATVTIPYGAYGTQLNLPSSIVSGRKGVSLKATYNGSTVSTTAFLNPIPPVTITQADYALDTHMLKIQASTPYTNSVLTFGGDPAGGPFGTMQFEQGVWKGSIVLDTAPTIATVWSSVGGSASMPVTVKTGTGGNSTGGGGGGSSSAVYKLVVKTVGKGVVTTTPSGTSFAAGAVVTLTATPDAGSIWRGWTGSVTSSSRTISVTINSDVTLSANFK